MPSPSEMERQEGDPVYRLVWGPPFVARIEDGKLVVRPMEPIADEPVVIDAAPPGPSGTDRGARE